MDKRRSNLIILILIFSFLAIIWLSINLFNDGNNKSNEPVVKKDYINYISFSADGKKLIFDRQRDKSAYQIQVYDLETNELSAYKTYPNEQWTMARYSFDGKHIVLSTIPKGPSGLDLSNMQLLMMDPNGENKRLITNSIGPKIYPSFSHSGDKIIYAKAGNIREHGRTPAADYDIFEVDIKNGYETRLTWFKFFVIFPPYLFPDDNTIISGAVDPPGMENIKCKNLTKEYVFILVKGQRDSLESLVCTKFGNRNGLISWDGKHIYFKATAQNPDGIHGDGDQYFEYIKYGEYHQITQMSRSTFIKSAALSYDWRYLALIVIDKSIKIKICNIETGNSRTLILPDKPTRIINGN